MEKKRSFRKYINYFRRKKEARMSIFYTVFYFVFITVLLLFGTTSRGQSRNINKLYEKYEKHQPLTSVRSLLSESSSVY
jgi:hypothetical protein